MSLTASLLKGKTVESSLDALFKNSAGPSVTPAPIPAKVRQPYPEDLPEQPKKKTKISKPQPNPNPKSKKATSTKSSSNSVDVDDKSSDDDEDTDEDSSKPKKKAKVSLEAKYEAQRATKPSKKDAKKATTAPKETVELVKQQTKHEYSEDEEEESKIEDLVHESLRNNKRKADPEESVESESGNKKTKKTKKSKDSEAADSDDEEDTSKDNQTQKDGATKADDPEKSRRTLFVGNLAVSSMSKGDFKKLKATFSAFGTIQSIRFRSIAFSELLPRKTAFITGKLHPDRDVVNAYIVFESKDSIGKAVAAMNGQLFLNRHLRVDTVDGAKKHQPKKSVFVGNLSFEAQEEDLWTFFKDAGDVENVRIIRDSKTNLGKGFAYVQFQDRASVDVALKLHDTNMGTRKLRVVRCKRIEGENTSTNGMGPRSSTGVAKNAKGMIKGKDGKPVKTQHAPIVMDGAAKRLAFKSRKANKSHILSKKKKGDIVEGERSQKGAKVDLGIKKGKAKVKANVPKKKVFKKNAN
ncbi:hypothetical protein B0O80DRAFT_494623 [Mortierella sp. GBAus27b]|nr:Nucleolar protein 12 [Mortierella sp. GBA43]KAI8360453.1 hypothetical protein B0O80DRAFT_494623 [Mortierella sp. GBAus27b]